MAHEARERAVPERSLKEELAEHEAELRASLDEGKDDGVALGRRRAALLDRLLARAWRDARAASPMKTPLALAAVGSYGRGAVALKSDADVRILVAGRGSKEDVAAFADALLYPLWDSGLAVGHQVIDPDEALALAPGDLTTATTLLDMRHVDGDPRLTDEIPLRAWGGIFAEGALDVWVDRLEEEAAGRHERFGASVYLLEPDVKSGAGGLRDVDAARWAARARFRVEDRGQGVWRELVRLGVLVQREAREIEEAEELLWRVRNRLHAHAGRRADRLTFDEQEAIAIQMGYGPDGSRGPSDASAADDAAPAELYGPDTTHGAGPARAGGARRGGAVEEPSGEARAVAAERLMQDYYVHARAITRARERLFERARPPRRRGRPAEVDLGGGVRLFDGQVTFAGASELAHDPALALRVYAACVRQNAPVLPFAREAIARAAADPVFGEALRASAEAAELFVELVCSVPEAKTRRGSIAGELHDVGLLLAMIPEFLPVTGRVHHDVYHVYTVDVHSVAALDCLRALARGELANAHPLASRLAAEIARPRPLFLATLLHDVGKGYPDANGSRKNHSTSGAELCGRILPRLGLSPDEVAEARVLVEQHLAMYHVATRRDLDDPATAEEFARGVRGREGLRDLYLLTVADITTTSPAAMTSWKSRMLEELYIATDAYLSGDRGKDDEARVAPLRDAAKALFTGPGAFFDDFVASLPERYLLANRPEAIAAHARVALDRALAQGKEPVRVALVPSRHPDVAELCVVAEDRPGLLARIAAALTAARLEVLAAQVYSRATPPCVEAVDLFWVRRRVDAADSVERGLPRLARDLADLCGGAVDPPDLLRARTGSSSPWRERPSPAVATEIVIDDRASPRHTIIEVFAKDRPGFMYTVAQALHDLGLMIALSKINTEGTRVADVFYVSELDGTKVVPGERFKGIREALTRAIES